VPFRWSLTGSTVDILLSDGTGSNFTVIANDIPNTGEFDYVVPASLPAGGNYRLRIVVNNDPATTQTASPFAVWGVTGFAVNVAEYRCENGVSRLRVHVSWNTSQPGTLSGNRFYLFPPNSTTPLDVVAGNTGTAHSADVWTNCATGTWTCRLYTNLSTTVTTPCASMPWSSGVELQANLPVSTCLTCGGGCRPPCEYN